MFTGKPWHATFFWRCVILNDRSQYVLRFGRYKGKCLQDVGVDYLVTLLDKCPYLWPATRQVIQEWLVWLAHFPGDARLPFDIEGASKVRRKKRWRDVGGKLLEELTDRQVDWLANSFSWKEESFLGMLVKEEWAKRCDGKVPLLDFGLGYDAGAYAKDLSSNLYNRNPRAAADDELCGRVLPERVTCPRSVPPRGFVIVATPESRTWIEMVVQRPTEEGRRRYERFRLFGALTPKEEKAFVVTDLMDEIDSCNDLEDLQDLLRRAVQLFRRKQVGKEGFRYLVRLVNRRERELLFRASLRREKPAASVLRSLKPVSLETLAWLNTPEGR
jgi:hypothetical protein